MQDLLKPATIVLLDALDSTMNSNTILLKVQTDRLLTANDDQIVLNMFLQSSLFSEMFLEFAWERQLGYSYITINDNTEGRLIVRSPSGSLLRAYPQLTLAPMSKSTFAQRLYWMLTTAFSPYQTHKSEQYAQEVINDFFWEIFTPESWPLERSETNKYWSKHPWSFYDVAPNFLHTTGYFNAHEEYEPADFAYFNGGETDTCTFFYTGNTFYLLLTNGSP